MARSTAATTSSSTSDHEIPTLTLAADCNPATGGNNNSSGISGGSAGSNLSQRLCAIAAAWHRAPATARPALEEQLLRQLGPFLSQRASMCQPWIDHEDALQIARIHAVGSLKSYNPDRGAAFWTWCYICVTNYLRDEISRARIQRQRHQQVPAYLDMDERPASDPAVPLEQVWDMARALAALPDELREIVELRCVEGLTLRQIGERIGRSGEYARQRLHTATRLLRDDLEL